MLHGVVRERREEGGGCCRLGEGGGEERERVLQELGEGGREGAARVGEGRRERGCCRSWGRERVLHGVVREEGGREGGGGRMLQVG